MWALGCPSVQGCLHQHKANPQRSLVCCSSSSRRSVRKVGSQAQQRHHSAAAVASHQQAGVRSLRPHVATAAAAASASAQQQIPGLDVPEGFDLALGIALAAAAFESYLEPVGANPQFQEVTVNNTHVTYTNRSFLQSNFDGILQLTIHGAKGLKAVNITGGSDPYVVATLGDSSATTEVVWGDLSPQWKETHCLYVQERSKALLKLRVMDKNKLMSDVDLGAVMTGLDALLEKPGRRVQLPLKGTNAQGTLEVSALFLPFTEEMAEAAVSEDTKKAPEAPEEVTQIATQLEVAMAVQDQLTSRVQQLATEIQQKVGFGGGADSPEAAAAATVASTDAAAAAVAAEIQLAAENGPELGAVVQEAEQKAVETLSTALDALQQRLTDTGLQDQAAAVASGRENVTSKVHEAADAVASFVKAEGLRALPASDLGGIIARIAASRMAKGSQQSTTPQLQRSPPVTPVAAAEAAAGVEGGDLKSLPAIVQEAMPQAWKALASCAGKMVDMFQPVAFVENKETDTQAWVYVCEELREVVVAFRGTEQVKWKDLVSDLNLVPTTLDPERTGGVDLGLGTIPMPFASFKKNKELMVHSGFLGAYDSIRNKITRIVGQVTADRSADKPWQVFMTGHSLGGALATLAAYEMAGRKGLAAEGIVVHMYTYGAPRVGNKAFAAAFNQRLKGNSWRITNASDIVPSVPRLMGYAHVARGVRLDSKGGLRFESGSKDILGEGREVAEVITDLASQAMDVAKGTKGFDEVVDAIREHEMQILDSLVDGSALGQHMEDFYLATLKQAVLVANPALAGELQQALEDVAAATTPAPTAAAETS